jgi:hypothetical protein
LAQEAVHIGHYPNLSPPADPNERAASNTLRRIHNLLPRVDSEAVQGLGERLLDFEREILATLRIATLLPTFVKAQSVHRRKTTGRYDKPAQFDGVGSIGGRRNAVKRKHKTKRTDAEGEEAVVPLKKLKKAGWGDKILESGGPLRQQGQKGKPPTKKASQLAANEVVRIQQSREKRVHDGDATDSDDTPLQLRPTKKPRPSIAKEGGRVAKKRGKELQTAAIQAVVGGAAATAAEAAAAAAASAATTAAPSGGISPQRKTDDG